MTVKYGKFQMPEKIKVDEAVQTATFGRFLVEPFEPGFGHTVGNALRRIMLGSLEAPAILSVRVEGVSHEYMAVDGIVQDMTHIVLNLKGALLRRPFVEGEEGRVNPREVKSWGAVVDVTDEMIERGKGEYKATLGELFGKSGYEVVNPGHVIFTVTKPMTRRVDFKVGHGRGYVPAERQNLERLIGEVVMDSAFSPVRLVNYYVENTRVGQDTDYDRLVLEVTTDGRVSPVEAVGFASQIAILHFKVFDEVQVRSIQFDRGETETNRDRNEILAKLSLKINEIELSVRSTNCLANANIETIGELVVMPEVEMLRFRNFGKKSLTEIKNKLDDLKLHLDMDLTKYGITRENVRPVLEAYRKEKSGGAEG